MHNVSESVHERKKESIVHFYRGRVPLLPNTEYRRVHECVCVRVRMCRFRVEKCEMHHYTCNARDELVVNGTRFKSETIQKSTVVDRKQFRALCLRRF